MVGPKRAVLTFEEDLKGSPFLKCGASISWALPVRGGHRALDGGQFRFWSNLKVPFYVHFWHILVIWDILSHI